jgi:hypothetical protein
MTEVLAIVLLALVLLGGAAWLLRRDPYPEEKSVEGFLREPNGRRADARRVLREELERAREHMRSRRRGKGASCLV